MIASASNEDLPCGIRGFTRDDQGVWIKSSRDEQETVSYPEDGNDKCFSVEGDSFWFKHRGELLVDLVRRYSDERVVFDIGGGNGYMTLALNRAGIETVLVEPGYAGCRNAVQSGVKHAINSTAEQLSEGAALFDAVALFDVLEHIEDSVGFLKELHLLSKPDAKLFISVPALSQLWSITDELAGHYRRYTKSSLSSELEASGWKPCSLRYFFTYAVAPVFLKRVLRSRSSEEESEKVHEAAVKDHGVAGQSGLLKFLLSIANRLDTFCFKYLGGVFPGSSLASVAVKKAL